VAHIGTEAAADATKQVVTLATGIIGLTVTFAEKFKSKDEIVVLWTMKGSWICFGVAIAFGVWTLLAIAGVANKAAQAAPAKVPDADETSIRIPAIVMVLAFVAGMVMVIWTGFKQFG